MGELDLTRAHWCKSIYSSANGACVEVAQNLPEIVAIRDSKNARNSKFPHPTRRLVRLHSLCKERKCLTVSVVMLQLTDPLRVSSRRIPSAAASASKR